MAEVKAETAIAAPLAGVWDLYFDRRRWASWVDGFAAEVSRSGYPERDGELVWRSTPAGRGQVTERVLAHEPRTLHRIAFEDPTAAGELETRFEILPSEDGRLTRVAQWLTYRVTSGGPLAPITDFLFIRSQMRGSLQRALGELKLEAERSGAG